MNEKCSSFSYWYAKEVVKNRWQKGENEIAEDPFFSYLYSLNIINGKLPQKMHHRMITHALKNPRDLYVKKYFDFIK